MQELTSNKKLPFKNWKRVRAIIDEGKQKKNKMALRNHCLANKDLFPYKESTFRNKTNLDDFSNEEESYIWDYLVKFHPDKVEIVLAEIENNGNE